MATTTKKGSKNTKAKPRRAVVKTPSPKRAQTIAELRRELEARNRDLVALYDVTAAASQSLEIKPVLDEVVKKITDIFAFDSVSVFLFDPKTEVLNLMAAAGIHEIQALPRAFRRGRGLTGRVAETGRYLIFEDVRSDSRYQQMTENNAMQRMGDCFIAIFPIKAKEKFLGTINFINREPRKLTIGEIRLINSMADQIGVAVENISLFEEVENKTKDLETSNAELREALEHQTATAEVLGIISRSPTDVQPVLDAIVESAARVCGIDDVLLRLRDGNSLVARAHFGPIPIGRVEVSVDVPQVLWMREHGTLHIPDTRSAQNDFPLLSRVPAGWRTWLAVPLRQQGEFIGWLGARRIEVRPFSPAQMKLLETFADQAVIAIENVRLFQELKESLEQQTATSEILGVIASSPTDVQPVLDTVAEHAARLCDASDALIFRVNGDRQERVASYGSMPVLEISSNSTNRGTPVGRAILERETIHVHDLLSSEADFPDAQARGVAMGVRTALVAPLLREGVSIGAIYIRRKEVRPFSDRHIKLLETFASQAVIAIENVRLFKEIQERNAELREALEHQTATAEVLGIISRSPTDVQPVLDAIVESAARVCGIDDVLLRLHEGDAMVLRAHFGPMLMTRAEISITIDAPQYPWMREHGALHIPDVLEQHDFPMVGVRGNFRTFLAAPLRQHAELIGILTARRTEVRPFTPVQIKLLETFADQAVIAIENVRLFQELKESLEQQTATSEILGVIASSPTDIQPVLDTIAKSAAQVCSADDAVIRLVERDGLRLAAHYGSIRIEVPVRPIDRDSAVGRAVSDRAVIHIEDLLAVVEKEFPITVAMSERLGIRTLLAAPLMRENQPIGVIIIRRMVVQPFSDKQIALLKTFADQAVIAIENVRLFQEIQERNAELREALEHQTATAEVLGIISRSPTDVQPVLDAIVESAALVCGIDDLGLHLREGDIMTRRAHFGPIPTPIARGEISMDDSQFRWMREHGTLHIPDASEQNDPQIVNISGWRSFLAVPLHQQGELIGGLTARRMEVRPFTPAQIKLLETFADQAVIAIENVRLFQELKESLEQQTATSEILGVIASSPTDIQPVLDTIAENAARVCGSYDAVIRLVEGNILRLAAHYGPVEPGFGVEQPLTRSSASGRAVLDRELIHIEDFMAVVATEFPEAVTARERMGGRTVLAAPLLREGVATGVILIRRTEVRPFTDKQTKLLETFAAQAVIAIENVRLFQELQERNAELREALEHQTATGEVLGIISRSPTNVQPVLDAIVESAAKVCGIDDVTLRLRERNEMVARAHIGPVPIFTGRESVGVDELHLRWVSEHGTLHIPDIRERQNDFPTLRSYSRTFLIIPLLQRRELVGTLTARRMEVRPFTPAQIKLLETFADQAVIAIENVRLFQELKESLEQQTATSHILGVIAGSPTDLQPVMDAIAENAARLCEANDALIHRIDGDFLKRVANYGPLPGSPDESGGSVPIDRGLYIPVEL
jgi:two-component system, NtrC family, sensor kinase